MMADVVIAVRGVQAEAERAARIARINGDEPVQLDDVHDLIALAFGELADRLEEADK